MHNNINYNNLFVINKGENLVISDFVLSKSISENALLREEIVYNDYHSCGLILYFMLFKTEFKNMDSLDLVSDTDIKDLLSGMLTTNKSERWNLDKIKVNILFIIIILKNSEWITKNKSFPLTNIHDQTLDVIFELSKTNIQNLSN